MTNYKNNLPPYVEEQIINEEVINIQQILNQFKQPVPAEFIELKQLNRMCSTQGWKEPVCERYNCLVKGEWKQVDITHTLLEELELETKNIPYPVHISPIVINNGIDRYLAYNVKNEKEIFLEKPFTVENLEENINELLDKIRDLEIEKGENQTTIRDLEKTKNDWKNEWLNEWRKKNDLEKEIQLFIQELKGEKQLGQSQKKIYQQKIQRLQTQLNQIQNECDALPVLPTLTDYLLLQTERDNTRNHLGINDLNNLPALPQGETLTSLLTRPTLTQLIDLIREKDQELTTANATITQKNSQISTLQTNYNNLNDELTTTRNELEKEQGWWDKWIGNHEFLIASGAEKQQIVFWNNDPRPPYSQTKFVFVSKTQGDSYEIARFIKTRIYPYYLNK
jgi:hypothetical protein